MTSMMITVSIRRSVEGAAFEAVVVVVGVGLAEEWEADLKTIDDAIST
jgi:hypothetical protein